MVPTSGTVQTLIAPFALHPVFPTPTFVEELVEEVNVYLSQDLIDLDTRIEETRKRLTEIERGISNLLDLAETFGTKTAAEGLLKCEAEQEQLKRELQSLEIRRKQSRIEVSPEVIFDVIIQARNGLTNDDVGARRALLQKFVDKVEIGSKRGKLWYNFPLAELMPDLTVLWLIPPRGFEPLSRA